MRLGLQVKANRRPFFLGAQRKTGLSPFHGDLRPAQQANPDMMRIFSQDHPHSYCSRDVVL